MYVGVGDHGLRKFTFLRGRALLLIALIAALCSISIPNTSAQQANVSVSPLTTTIEEEDIGKLFNVSVVIENVPADPGAETVVFKLSWNLSILEGVSMVLPPGHFLEPDGDEGNLWKISHDVSSGYVMYQYSFWDYEKPYLPKSGAGTLAIITLKSIAPGTTSLDLDLVSVATSTGDEISTTLNDGTVVVVPEFSGFMLLLLLMVATLFAIILGRKSLLTKHLV